jgi:hypothetical protein
VPRLKRTKSELDMLGHVYSGVCTMTDTANDAERPVKPYFENTTVSSVEVDVVNADQDERRPAGSRRRPPHSPEAKSR